MARTFELFHLSLVERRDLFTAAMPREDWLRHAFAAAFTFSHRGKDYHWVPQDTDSVAVVGNVARLHKRLHHTPPDEGAMEVASDEWQGSLVIIDPTHHDDGQKLSFERDSTIGKPRSVLQSLLSYVNALGDAPYTIEPKPIFHESTFWAWAAAHENRVRRITFDFVVPNMWQSASDLDEELKELGTIGTQRARLTLEGTDGVGVENQTVQEGVEYAARGGGSITAKAQNGDKFSSTESPTTATLPAEPAEAGGIARVITKWLPRLLGREQGAALDIPSRSSDGPAGG